MNFLLSFYQASFEWVWKTSVWAAVLTALVVLVQWLLGKRLGPRLHYALSLLVLIRLLLPALPVSRLSLEKFIPHKAALTRPVALAYYYPADDVKPAITRSQSAGPSLPLGQKLQPKAIITLGCGVWLLGVFVLAGLAVWRYRQWSRRLADAEIISDFRLLALLEESRKEMGVCRRVTPLSVAQASSPAVFGILNVRLILPHTFLRRLDDDELRMVLLHEMAHVRRHDALFNTLLMVVQFLHWFNPLVWLALHRIRADRETICDAMVMRKTDVNQRASYGRLLLRLIEQFPAGQRFLPSNAAMVGSQNEIKRRILMIKNHGKKQFVGGFMAIIAIGLLGCAAFTRAENPGNTSSSTSAVPTPTGQVGAESSVQATGTPPLYYQWYFNDSNASSATAPTSPAAPDQTTAQFRVVANGSAPLNYQWYIGSNTSAAAVPMSSSELANQLIGTWVLDKELGPKSNPSGVGVRMKSFTGTHWEITQPDPKTGVIIFHHGGTYKLEGDKYFEHKDFAGESTKDGMGNTGEFTIKIEGDMLTQTGINNPWNEVWKRVK
jgi:bla regulator protein BlaR1